MAIAEARILGAKFNVASLSCVYCLKNSKHHTYCKTYKHYRCYNKKSCVQKIPFPSPITKAVSKIKTFLDYSCIFICCDLSRVTH
jgi:hypothetical protein